MRDIRISLMKIEGNDRRDPEAIKKKFINDLQT
jgi:hypothetical protein